MGGLEGSKSGPLASSSAEGFDIFGPSRSCTGVCFPNRTLRRDFKVFALLYPWSTWMSLQFRPPVEIEMDSNPGTPEAPFGGFWMRIRWDRKRLEAFLHPNFSFWPFMLDYEKYPYEFVVFKFFFLTFHVGLWRVSIWVCSLASVYLQINWKLRKKQITKIFYFNIFWEVTTPCSKSEISPQKWYFLNLRPTSKMKIIYSSFYSN